MESTICLLTEWTQKAGGHFKADSVFLIKKGTCVVVKDIALHLERKFGCSKKHCSCLCGRVEADSGNKSSTLFLSWHSPVYGLSACGILVRLGIWKASQSRAVLGSFSARLLLINFFNSLSANIKEWSARARSADGCFSWEAVPMAGLIFCKGICTLVIPA